MNKALIIIDMQNDFVLPSGAMPVPTAMDIVNDLKRLLVVFRKNKDLIIHVIREYRKNGSDIERFRMTNFTNNPCAVPGTFGSEIIKEIAPNIDEIVLVKNRFSAFMGTELDLILRRYSISELYISGIQYPNCIRATVYDAVALDYNVTIVNECTGAASKEIAESNIRDIKGIGVKFVKIADVENG